MLCFGVSLKYFDQSCYSNKQHFNLAFLNVILKTEKTILW